MVRSKGRGIIIWSLALQMKSCWNHIKHLLCRPTKIACDIKNACTIWPNSPNIAYCTMVALSQNSRGQVFIECKLAVERQNLFPGTRLNVSGTIGFAITVYKTPCSIDLFKIGAHPQLQRQKNKMLCHEETFKLQSCSNFLTHFKGYTCHKVTSNLMHTIDPHIILTQVGISMEYFNKNHPIHPLK